MSVEISQKTVIRKTVRCLCPLNPAVSDADIEQLEQLCKKVRVIDRRLFNMSRIGSVASNVVPTSLLLFERSLTIPGVGQMGHKPFNIIPNMLEFGLVYKLPEAPNITIDDGSFPDPERFNSLSVELIKHFTETISNVDVIRVGKIYEYMFGPFEQGAALAWLSEKFAKVSLTEECGTLQNQQVILVFAKDDYNININIGILKVNADREIIQIILDINNKDNTRALDWPKARVILDFASNFHKNTFWELFKEK